MAKKTRTYSRLRAVCANGHDMVSMPASRPDVEQKLRDHADECGCGYGRCEAKLARIEAY